MAAGFDADTGAGGGLPDFDCGGPERPTKAGNKPYGDGCDRGENGAAEAGSRAASDPHLHSGARRHDGPCVESGAE